MKNILLLLLFVCTFSLLAGPNCGADHSHDEASETTHSEEHKEDDGHKGHDHDGEHGDEDAHKGHDHDGDHDDDHDDDDGHKGHDHAGDHADEAGHEGHDHGTEEAGHIELSEDIIERIGLTLKQVQLRSVTSYITVPGEVKINEDKLAHINPSYPSKCVKVYVRQGQYVRRGALLATLTNRETLSNYNIYAPIAGRIISKHLTKGEVVSEEERLFSIADLSTVWGEFMVPLDRIDGVEKSGEMLISLLSHEDEPIEGKVIFIDPIVDPQTRRVMVRAEIANGKNRFRPGSYLTARIDYGDAKPVISVELDAVQTIAGEEMLFVPEEGEKGAYKPVEVKTGRKSSRYVEIVRGIESGATYVHKGAFALKAEMVTKNMDPHAGHNH